MRSAHPRAPHGPKLGRAADLATTRFRRHPSGHASGDVRARIDEIHESLRLIREIRQHIPQGPTVTQPTGRPAWGPWALSAVEGWRGETLYMVMAGENGGIHRCKVRDPSFVSWPAIQYAVLGNIIPDFPVIHKSFNMSYAGTDL